jgi:hypothetical protein
MASWLCSTETNSSSIRLCRRLAEEVTVRRYTFLIGTRETVCELSGISLSDDETACGYAIAFASEVFRLHYEICAGEWHLCSVRVLTSAQEEVFLATVPEAAAMERDAMRLDGESAANN